MFYEKSVQKCSFAARKKMKRVSFDLGVILYVTLNKPEMKWFEHERTFECHNRELVI